MTCGSLDGTACRRCRLGLCSTNPRTVRVVGRRKTDRGNILPRFVLPNQLGRTRPDPLTTPSRLDYPTQSGREASRAHRVFFWANVNKSRACSRWTSGAHHKVKCEERRSRRKINRKKRPLPQANLSFLPGVCTAVPARTRGAHRCTTHTGEFGLGRSCHKDKDALPQRRFSFQKLQ